MKWPDITKINILFVRTTVAVKNRQKGLTTVEYAMAGALVTAGLVGAFSALGDQVGNMVVGLVNAIGG